MTPQIVTLPRFGEGLGKGPGKFKVQNAKGKVEVRELKS